MKVLIAGTRGVLGRRLVQQLRDRIMTAITILPTLLGAAEPMECDREIRFQTVNPAVTLHSPSIGRTCNL
jgi:nucleoside-diphosphate-sugar epimerase